MDSTARPITSRCLKAGRDPLQPTKIAESLLQRQLSPTKHFSSDLKALSTKQTQDMLNLAARGWPPTAIARRLGLDTQLVSTFVSSTINAQRISELSKNIPPDDELDSITNPEIFYKTAELMTREKLLTHALSGSDYVSLSAIKNIADRAIGKPVEHVKVHHEHSLAGMLEDIYERRAARSEEILLPQVSSSAARPQKEEPAD